VSEQSNKGEKIQQRLNNFGARTTLVAKMLPATPEGRYISRQLLRSGLAAAPNYAEARASESRADFIHKLRIALKELNETKSWLDQIIANGLSSREKMDSIVAENRELCWILAASIRTARGAKSPI
jgi:four helix bundle protein